MVSMFYNSYNLCCHLITHNDCVMVGSTVITMVIQSTGLKNTMLFESSIFAIGIVIKLLGVVIQGVLLFPGFIQTIYTV